MRDGRRRGARARALRVDHPDPADAACAAVNALVVFYAIIALGIRSPLVPLSFIPGGRTSRVIVALVTAARPGSARRARPPRAGSTSGCTMFFGGFIVAFAAVLLVGAQRLAAAPPIYSRRRRWSSPASRCERPAIAVVTAVVARDRASSAPASTRRSIRPIGAVRDHPAAVLVIVDRPGRPSLLGLWGQRQEAQRADAAARTRPPSSPSGSQRSQRRARGAGRSQRTEELQLRSRPQESARGRARRAVGARPADRACTTDGTPTHELPRLVASAERHGQPLALAMADLDHFKQVNDATATRVGDEVLRRSRAILPRTRAASDVVTRYGGEEFLLVMPQTTLDQAASCASGCAARSSVHPWHEVAAGLRVTVSIGVADTVHHDGLVTLVGRGRRALHQAKRTRPQPGRWPWRSPTSTSSSP